MWLVHKAGFTGARVLKSADTPDGTDPPAEGRCKVKLDYNGQVLEVDEEDVEKVCVGLWKHRPFSWRY